MKIDHKKARKLYSVLVGYPGHDFDYDRQIEKKIRKSIESGGYCFLDGLRDLRFDFVSKDAAKAAAKRVRDMRPKKRGTRVSVNERGIEL